MSADSPDALGPVRELDARARHVTSPCGAGKMRWRIWGEGQPLVVLHGGFGSWQHWVRNVDPLSRRVQVIAGDLPGLGDSHEAPHPHTADGIAAVLHQGICEILGEDRRLSLAGFSLGGAIAAVLAARLGPRLDQLLLFAPSAMGTHWRPIGDKVLRWAPDATDEERLATVRANLAISMIADTAKIDDMAVRMQDRLIRQKRRLKGLPISTSDTVVRALGEVRGETTIVWGAKDAYVHPDVATCAANLRAVHPHVDCRILPGVGHWVVYEAHEAMNALIIGKLREAVVQ